MAARLKSVRVATLDQTFSLAVRASYDNTCAYPGCPYCGNVFGGADDCAHYRRRRHSAGRWFPDNCAALCRQIHCRIDERQEELVEFFRNELGEVRWDALLVRLQKPRKYTPYDRWEMNQHYREEVKRIEDLRKNGETGYIPLVSYD